MQRIEPTIGPSLTPNDLQPELPPTKQQAKPKSAIRRSNQRKIAISTVGLYAITAGILAFLSHSQPDVNAAAVGFRLGEIASYFFIAMILALGFTFFSRKAWTWGFAVFLVLVFLVPVFLVSAHG